MRGECASANSCKGIKTMAKCIVCGKGPQVGQNVSHANNKTKRWFNPNLQRIRVRDGGSVKRANVCTGCLKSGRVTKAA